LSARPARPLGSTYRLQLNGVGFDGARRLVAYLDALGIETLYLSPVTAAAPGSPHGYDVVDPNRLDPVQGTEADFEALLAELDAHGMRLLLDVVPNHMATDPANEWWWDVLRLGPNSPHAPVFDIDWAAGDWRVVLSTLPAPLAAVLRTGEVAVHPGRLLLSVEGQDFPLDPASSPGAGDDAAAVLAAQHYRLAYWRLGRFEGNYRRFFDIDGLVGVRLEDEAVYEATHRLALALARDPRVAGLRIDHIDGLADPTAYLRRLVDDVESGRGERPCVVVEKILGPGETLPPSWPIDGTTGYEFADLTTRLFVDPAGAAALDRLGAESTGDDRSFDELVAAARRGVVDALFPGQFDRLVGLAAAALTERVPGHDLARPDVAAALRALLAHLHVYRTYVGRGPADRADRARLAAAATAARPELGPEAARALDSLVAVVHGAGSSPVSGPRADARSPFISRLQQLSGAVAAKGVEDTACYGFHGLLASAEVGGDPGRPSLGVPDLHAALAARARLGSCGLNALSTHDTKRSADVRARLAVLSEAAPEWEALVRRWHRRHVVSLGGGTGPDPHDELFFYQSLFGVWPADGGAGPELTRRLRDTMRKAARESKRRTSWIDPDLRYERVLRRFVEAVLGDPRTRAELDRLVRRLGPAAATNSLAMTVLAATAPGVPDLYQGGELWDLSLVDPDSRRPVDFGARQAALAELAEEGGGPTGAEVAALLAAWPDGRVKLHVTSALLRLRRCRPELFARGAYLPLSVRGPGRDRLVAFARRRGPAWSVTVVPRLTMAATGPGRFALGTEGWGASTVVLPAGAPGAWRDVLSGSAVRARAGSVRVGDLLSTLPVAVLTPR